MYRYRPVTHSKKLPVNTRLHDYCTWSCLAVIFIHLSHIHKAHTAWKVLKKMFYLIDIKYLTKTISITKLCAWSQLFHDSTAMCISVPCYHPRFSLPKSVNIKKKKQTQIIIIMFLCYKCSILKHELYAESMHHVILQFTFLHHYTITQHCAEFELCDVKNC